LLELDFGKGFLLILKKRSEPWLSQGLGLLFQGQTGKTIDERLF
jgi:hypothetical protein